MLSTRATWIVAAVTIVSRSCLSTIVALLLWGVLPNVVGFQTTTVMSGSMEPHLMVGDAIVVRHVDAAGLAPGQVLLFDDPDETGRLRMHRLMAVQTDGELVTKGDANRDRDSSTMPFDAVHGAAFLRVPFAGLPEYWIRTGRVAPLAGAALLVVVLLSGVRLGRLLEDAEERERRRHRGARRTGLHRAAAAGAALVVLGGAVAIPGGARAAFAAPTASVGNQWGTTCTDRTPTDLGSNPVLYWGYGTGSGQDAVDLSGQGDTGTSPSDSDAVRITSCADGYTPAVQVGSTGKGIAVEKTAHAFPGAMTVATWFKTSNPGGVLADFGGSNTVTAPSSTSRIDRVLYMQGDGNLSFGANTLSVAGVLSAPMICTTSRRGGYADGGWHLAVATYSNTAGCTLTVDADPQVAVVPQGLGLLLLSGYQGYWRFGYDAVSAAGGWTGATSRQHFQGSLDESQVYGAVLDASARGDILRRGH